MMYKIILSTVLFTVSVTSVSAQNKGESSLPAPSYVHGMGISLYSQFDPERSYQEAKKRAIEDLSSNLMTSVYLEYYGSNSLPTQLKSEFAINFDSLESSKLITVDSLHFNDWALFLLKYNDLHHEIAPSIMNRAELQKWTEDVFNPVKVSGYWISSGTATLNSYNPYRSWTVAKQNALKKLSTHLQTVVQASAKVLNEEMAAINYTTSKNIFSKIHILKRKVDKNKVFILIAVSDSDIYKLE